MFKAAVQDEAALRAALADADIAPMLMVLAQLSGDMDILDEVAPHIYGAWSFMEAVPEDLKQKVRDRLVASLQDYAATGRQAPIDLPTDTLQRMMSAGVGQIVPADYIPLLVEETQLASEDSRAVHWRRPDVAADGFKVVIIGAGFSGLCSAIRLKEMGIPFLNSGKKPGCRGHLAGKHLSRLCRRYAQPFLFIFLQPKRHVDTPLFPPGRNPGLYRCHRR